MTLRDTLESVLDTVKSMLGQGGTEPRTESERDVGVTVEREGDEEPAPPSSPTDESADEETDADEADTAEETEADAGGSDESPDVLEGIGPTYAERLADAGIETVADLAAADAADLAPQIDNVGESRIEDWIQRANER